MSELGNAEWVAKEYGVGHILADRYCIEHCIDCGSMGVVVAARDLETDGWVAIKLIAPELRNDSTVETQFIGEALALRCSEGPHCVPVLDVGRSEQFGPFLVMEYLEGSNLGELLKSGYRPDLGTSVDYVRQACEALQLSHRQGIVHCDVKPQNLFLIERWGQPCIQLLDFGIARSAPGSSLLGETLRPPGPAAVRGTPHYLSPEQLRSCSELDCRADIWSLGTVLYELITGQEAFAGRDLKEILSQVLQASPPDPLGCFPGQLESLYAIVLRCLARNPDDRFSDVAELSEALKPFGSDFAPDAVLGEFSEAIAVTEATGSDCFQLKLPPEPIEAPVSRRLPRAENWMQRHTRWIAVAAGICGIMLSWLYFSPSRSSRQTGARRPDRIELRWRLHSYQRAAGATRSAAASLAPGHRRDQGNHISRAHLR